MGEQSRVRCLDLSRGSAGGISPRHRYKNAGSIELPITGCSGEPIRVSDRDEVAGCIYLPVASVGGVLLLVNRDVWIGVAVFVAVGCLSSSCVDWGDNIELDRRKA